jgi:hypothetical protein
MCHHSMAKLRFLVQTEFNPTMIYFFIIYMKYIFEFIHYNIYRMLETQRSIPKEALDTPHSQHPYIMNE